MPDAAVPPRPRLLSLAASIALTLAVGAVGGAATASSVGTWYVGLAKPPFNPPNWIFGPVWTTLYILMAVAAWRVYQRAEGRARIRALGLYLVQLTLNLGWSLIFFGLRNPALALVELAALLVALVLTLVAFWRIDRLAGALLAPYLAWSSFAFALNAAIWRLNS